MPARDEDRRITAHLPRRVGPDPANDMMVTPLGGNKAR
jgi:hypothetical protein